MEILIFGAFAVAYAILFVSHKSFNPRAYKLFLFGFMISLLYASIYSIYADMYLIFILLLTSLAILTQYFHIRAVEAGTVKPTKQIVNVDTPAQDVLLKEKTAKPMAKAVKARSRKK